MKNLTISLIAILALCLGTSLSAQTTATWKGGKPGRTTDWNCAANWLEGSTPDEFAQVIIPSGADYYPVIKNEVTPIDALLMEGGASLTIQDGSTLTVLGETGRFDGLMVFGNIINNGTLAIGETISISVASMQQIQGVGSVVNPFANLDSLARR